MYKDLFGMQRPREAPYRGDAPRTHPSQEMPREVPDATGLERGAMWHARARTKIEHVRAGAVWGEHDSEERESSLRATP